MLPVVARSKKQRQSRSEPKRTDQTSARWFRNPVVYWSFFSALATWCAFPPLGFWPLAWLAPLGWIRIIRMAPLGGQRPQRTIFLGGYVHWLLMTHWVTLPHPLAALGWLFLAAYLAAYVWGFVALARAMVHRSGVPIFLAAPLSWVSMELLRSYLFTGWALEPLSHSQVSLVSLIQVSSFTGAYGVSFLVVLVAGAMEHVLDCYLREKNTRLGVFIVNQLPILGIIAAVVAGVVCWGYQNIMPPVEPTRNGSVALIQGALDTEFGSDPAIETRMKEAFDEYLDMSIESTSRSDVDLVIWPESMFRIPIVEFDPNHPWANDKQYSLSKVARELNSDASNVVTPIGCHCLMGTTTRSFELHQTETFNTAAFYDPTGKRLNSYHKMHPVMFGEYFPLGNVFPWLYDLIPIGGISAGTEAKVFKAGDLSFVPNICFENTVPHLIRRQLRDVSKAYEHADVLVTLTNDGWFWGSSLLDAHLACGVFRAVENRRTMLIAANTGFSAQIDQFGQIIYQGPRRESKAMVVNVEVPDQSTLTFYCRYGDWFAGSCLICSVLLAIFRKNR